MTQTPTPAEPTLAECEAWLAGYVTQLSNAICAMPAFVNVGAAVKTLMKARGALAHLRASQAPASAALLAALEAGARALTQVGHKPTCATYPIGASATCDCGLDRKIATLRRHAEGVKT